MQLITILGIALAAIGVAFALQNNVPVTVTLLVWRFDSTLAMVLLVALALGAIMVALVSTPSVLRRQWQLARQRRDIASLNAAVAELQAGIERLQGPEERNTPAKPPA